MATAASTEELREELEQERAARQELEAALQEAAKYGQELLGQVQEQEHALAAYREKVRSLEETPYKSQASTSRKSVFVEDLMQHNQSLEDDVRRLQQKLNEEMEEDSDEEEGHIRPKRRSRRALRAIEVEDQTEEAEMEEDYEAQIMQLQQQLQAARKESATTQKSLQAELDAKKQELQEHFQAEQDTKASSAQIEAKLKALQKQWDILVQQNRQAEEELHNAKTKERELTFQLEQQTLRNEVRHSTQNWMPASEEALRNAAPQPSLADEFQDMEGEQEEEGENEDRSESEKGDLQNQSYQAQARIETLQFELQSVQAGATKEIHQLKERYDASQAESTKEIKELQEKLAATKAEAAAAVQEHETLQEQTQAVLAENARLRQEVQILEEANEVRTNGAGGTRLDVEESFWSKVLGTIACARTTPEPSPSPCRNPELQMHLAMPETEAAAAGKAN
eukprot:symbB.v1.2.021701.t1/scaffold1891.1/size97027/6